MIGPYNDGQFEVHVLACLLKSPVFAEQVMGVLGVDACPESPPFATNKPWNDFSQDVASALFTCIKRYREQLGTDLSALTEELLTALLNQIALERHGIIGPGPEVQMAIELYRRVVAANLVESTEIVRLGFIDWLRKRRMALVMERYKDRRSSSAATALAALESHNKAIDHLLVDEVEAFTAFGHARVTSPVELIPTNLRAFDNSLGGGFGKGDFSLIIAPSGGGKTVIAAQMASTFALRGKKVLLITTEQSPDELELRIFSNVCQISHGKIRAGLDHTVLDPQENERIEKLKQAIGPCLHFADWTQDRSRSIRANLKAEIERFISQHERIDALIFDWIGGALGTLQGTDQHELRLALQDTGDALADFAKEFRIVVIGFAQAAIGSTRNKRRIEQADIAECKSLGRSATNVIGLSAMHEEDSEDGPSYAPIQHLFVSKARKSAGGNYRVRRNFEYQRLEDV